jgi:hypothetical protein
LQAVGAILEKHHLQKTSENDDWTDVALTPHLELAWPILRGTLWSLVDIVVVAR